MIQVLAVHLQASDSQAVAVSGSSERGLLKHRLQGPDSVGMGWGSGICISSKFQGDAYAAGHFGPGTTV